MSFNAITKFPYLQYHYGQLSCNTVPFLLAATFTNRVVDRQTHGGMDGPTVPCHNPFFFFAFFSSKYNPFNLAGLKVQ